MLPIMSNGCESWIGTGSEAGFLLGYAPIYLRTSRDHQQLSHLDACPNIIYIYIYIYYIHILIGWNYPVVGGSGLELWLSIQSPFKKQAASWSY